MEPCAVQQRRHAAAAHRARPGVELVRCRCPSFAAGKYAARGELCAPAEPRVRRRHTAARRPAAAVADRSIFPPLIPIRPRSLSMFAQIVRRTALRRQLILTTALCGAALLPHTAAAQQMGDFGTVIGTVGSGTTVDVDGSTLNVGAQGNGIVNWNDFNIREGRTANFRNRDGASAPKISILNRVNGTTSSDISGTLNSDANVDVYIINRSGIVFGSGARVNVGGLVASTLDLDDSDFLNGDQSLRFIGNIGETLGIDVNAGATFDVPGNLLMLGAYVNTQAPITAGGDLAFVAGNDIVVQSTAGAPLKFVINRGTAVPGAIRVQGDLKGQNVTLAMATRAGINNALLYIDGSVESTGAHATDNGVVLASGMSPYLGNVEVV
ncbi:MAG: filamentous hemagglutinin N-terminal domain-containing protein, partial [Sphingomonadales bacterium]